jgi:hypothetical protein
MPLNQFYGIHLSASPTCPTVSRWTPSSTTRTTSRACTRSPRLPPDRGRAALGIKDNLMPVKFLLEKIPVQCQGIIAADPFLIPAQEVSRELL